MALELDGKTVQAVFTDITKAGIPASDAAVLVSSWIFENFGKAKRVFNYQQPFAAVDPNCVAKFNRTFQHDDWIDGESVVQAQQTSTEEGFNVRFHRIEDDLEALKADVVHSYACMAAMRSSLRVLLDELRAEVNRLNNDVFTCCNKGAGTVSTAANFGSLVESSVFAGVAQFNNKAVSLWKTDKGLMMLPSPLTVGIDVITDDRIRRAADLARLIEDNPAIRNTFANQQFNKAALIGRFGDIRTKDGRPLRDLVSILPESATFGSVDALIEDITDRESASLRTTDGADASLAAIFGLDVATEKVEDAALDKLAIVPTQARTALIRAGIDTVGKLAKQAPRDLAAILKREGIANLDAGDAAEWTALAKTLSKTR